MKTIEIQNMPYAGKRWFDIQNKSSGPTQVMIYADIASYGIGADDFVSDLRKVSGDVELHINSQGGDVFEGITIYNYLASRPGTVSVVVDGVAASIASVIAMAASPGELSMAANASMMIHDAHSPVAGYAGELRQRADLLDKVSANIASVYAERTGQPAETWRTAMQAETWYSAQEAVDAGLADKVLPGRVRNSLSNNAGELDNASKPHGDVPYADPGYLDADGNQASKSGKEGVARYPIDEEHVQAAWSYINQEKNASQYTAEQLDEIKSKIKSAMKKFGHEVADNQIFIQIQATLKDVFNA